MADFRFTPSTATTTIPYWIDSDTNTPNGFRVKISTLLAGNNTIYMYYGNPSAVVGSSVTAVWGSGLVGYWAFGEGSGTTAKDASGNNNNGTLTNSPTWVAGKYGIALSFNGSNNYVISPTAGFSTGNASRTMECWVRTASADTLHVITYGTLTVNTGSFIYMAGGKMMMGFYSNDLDSGFSINNSIWRHIVFTFDGSTVRTYVDGINGATASKTAATATGTSFYAGQRGDSIYYLPGSIDEIRIYNRALSESEIKSRYAATEPTISSVGNEEGAFFSTGTYRSAVTDTASKIVVSSVSWNPATQPTSTQLAVSIRASKNSFAADAASPPWSQITNGSNPGIVGRYIQYASTFTTSVTTSTPRLEDITLTYKLAKPWKEKSIVRTGTSAYGFYGGDDWTWEVPVKGGQLVTITSYIRYNTQYSGGTFDKPKLTLSGLGINESISATAGAENSWEQRQLSGTPSADGILILRAEGFSTNAGARFYIDDINVLQ
ncbi:MAG: hypothetical protein CVU77_07110 [Elusimicrobia bacterium HGW-Elusimicrobia-1]|nr:MAG: hypothetical protein CVU77_07110 [Elusimicrobia bacterium HGW-Elusimicrobia-1]